MKFRFWVYLLFAVLTCAIVQSKGGFRSGRKSWSSSKPSSGRRTHTTYTTHSNPGSRTYGGSASGNFLHGERGGHTNLPILPPAVLRTNSESPRRTEHHYQQATPRNVITPTAAPTTIKEYPSWANPHLAPNQQNKPVVNNYNNHGISVPHSTRSPLGTQIYGGPVTKPQSTTTTGIRPNHNSPLSGNSTFPRTPIAPHHNSHTTYQPFHKTKMNQSHSMPIPNSPPYPLYPVHPTPMHTSHAIPQQNAPPPFGSSPVVHTPSQNFPNPMMSPHAGNVMYPNQYPHPQPNYQGFPSNPGGSYPGGSYHGGIYSGPSFASHGGQPYYPQQGPISHSAGSPPVIIMPSQQDNGRGVGQIFKEALIYSGVNAAVNRIVNPSLYHHHHDEYSGNYGRPVPATQNSETSNTHSTTHTEITYNNQYFNTVPGSNGSVPGQPGVAQPQVPVWNSPGGINSGGAYQPGSAIPAAPGIVGQPMAPGTATVGQPVAPGTPNTQPVAPGIPNVQPVAPGTTNVQPVAPGTTNVQPVAPSTPLAGQPAPSASTNLSQSGQIVPPPHTAAPVNGTETPATTFQYRITNEELQSLSEELFNKDEFNAYKYISLNIQGRSTGTNVSDQAAKPLFQVMPVAYTIPTVQALRSLYQHYTPDSRVKENMTIEKRIKENVLLDIFLTTNVMSITTKWLHKQGFVNDDDYEKKDMLKRLWFTQFDDTSSAFERVFAAEIFEGTDVLGVQDWVHFDYHESNNRIDYLGFVDKLQFGDKAAMLKVDFRFDGALRHNGTVFVGTSPELEMALYTICYHARPGDMCPISLGGTKLNLYTNPYRYLDKDTIDLALPLF